VPLWNYRVNLDKRCAMITRYDESMRCCFVGQAVAHIYDRAVERMSARHLTLRWKPG
jgi:hypothetical protein